MVVLLEHHVEPLGLGIELPLILAEQFPEPDAEALGLVQLRGGQEPLHPIVESTLGFGAHDVAHEDLAIGSIARGRQRALHLGVEALTPFQAEADRIGGSLRTPQELPIGGDAAAEARVATTMFRRFGQHVHSP